LQAQAQFINLTAKHLKINNSSVSMENVQISSVETAITNHRSSITATNSQFAGQPAILVDSSRIDFAGVTINSPSAPIQTRGGSSYYFSVSEQNKNNVRSVLHQRINICSKDYRELFE
jgi:hypothetical protein